MHARRGVTRSRNSNQNENRTERTAVNSYASSSDSHRVSSRDASRLSFQIIGYLPFPTSPVLYLIVSCSSSLVPFFFFDLHFFFFLSFFLFLPLFSLSRRRYQYAVTIDDLLQRNNWHDCVIIFMHRTRRCRRPTSRPHDPWATINCVNRFERI